jgi:hypothetical protein
MKLNTKTITIRGEKFEVRELTIKEMMPLMAGLSEDPEAGQMALVKKCVYRGGVLVGEELETFPAGAFLKLTAAVTEVNDLGGDEGND